MKEEVQVPFSFKDAFRVRTPMAEFCLSSVGLACVLQVRSPLVRRFDLGAGARTLRSPQSPYEAEYETTLLTTSTSTYLRL